MILDNIRLYDGNQPDEKDAVFHLIIENDCIKAINKGRYTGDKTVIDGKKRVLCPSFTDTHLHLLRYGLMKMDVDLREAESWEKVRQLLSEDRVQQKLEESEWLVARGLTDDKYEDIAGLAQTKDLDDIEDERPMFILHQDGHECVVNSPALDQIREDDSLSEEHSPFIEKDEQGNWTGRFKDTAVHYIKFHFRAKSNKEIDQALGNALPYLARYGITSVHSDDLNYAGNYAKVWKGYRRLEKRNLLTVRAFLHHYVFNIDDMHYFLEHSDKRTGDGTEKVRIGAFKIFVDGTHRLHTAALEQPYHDEPEGRGILNYKQSELNRMLQLAEGHDMQVAMHCIGDRAVKSALHAIEKAGTTMRHRIIHAQTLSDDLLQKIATLKPCFEIQPGFLLDEWNSYAQWVGEKRGPYCGMIKSLQATGAPVSLSSDAPIGPINPFEHIFAAVNRRDYEGHPQGGWIPSEKITTDAAFKGYTQVPAYLEFMEGQKGVIKEGAIADFILLDDYPSNVSHDKLHRINVQQTWLGGEKVYDAADEGKKG